MTSRIISAKQNGPSYWCVVMQDEKTKAQYNSFMHESEYKLKRYTEKLLNERTILPDEIEELLDLHSSVMYHDQAMEERD